MQVFQEVYTCWIFLGSHLNRVLQSFLLFTFDFVKFLMTFLSRLKLKGWDRCMGKAVFPVDEWFKTSKKRLSCCLKSYSTLERQACKPKKHRFEQKMFKIHLQMCQTTIFFLHIRLFIPQITVATVLFCLVYYPSCGKLCTCHISKLLIGLERKTFAARVSFFFWRYHFRVPLSSTWHLRTGCQHTPVNTSTYVTSFCHAKALLKISRSREMFWIFQDKDCFRFGFVEHGDFFPKRWWEDF